ncbi:MAG: type II toxin-antitoxin system VapC family toxin [Pseudomonadota bacterium]|nr:type II toxin-antitoxin system VapC family toxin [Pseudomonadota bacterium]
MSLVYLDTSALANRYLRAPISDAVDALLDEPAHTFALSELSLVELESALSRQHREGRVTARKLSALRTRFESDLRLDFFTLHPLSRPILIGARQLIADGIAPLAALDAIHVKTALEIEADAFATDDEQLARAAARHGLEVITFSSPP